LCLRVKYLDDDVNAEVRPWQLERIPVGDDGDQLAVHADGPVVDDLDVGLEGAEHRIVLEKVRRLNLMVRTHATQNSIIFHNILRRRRASVEQASRAASVNVTYVLDTSAVVDDDDVERGVLAAVPATEEVATDAAEPVDRHLELRHSWRPHSVLAGGLSQVKKFRIP
jgi:hypothetical protein